MSIADAKPFRAKARSAGKNSVGVTIPQDIAKRLRIRRGTELEVVVRNIAAKKTTKKPAAKKTK